MGLGGAATDALAKLLTQAPACGGAGVRPFERQAPLNVRVRAEADSPAVWTAGGSYTLRIYLTNDSPTGPGCRRGAPGPGSWAPAWSRSGRPSGRPTLPFLVPPDCKPVRDPSSGRICEGGGPTFEPWWDQAPPVETWGSKRPNALPPIDTGDSAFGAILEVKSRRASPRKVGQLVKITIEVSAGTLIILVLIVSTFVATASR